ncbi:MAG: ATP-binding protein, partial [Pseudomonadota bacterium]
MPDRKVKSDLKMDVSTLIDEAVSGKSARRQILNDPQVSIEQAWRIIIDALPDAAIAIDSAGFVRHHNAAAVVLFPSVRLGTLISSVTRHPALHEAISEIHEGSKRATVHIVERVPVERRISATLAPLISPNPVEDFPDLLIVFKDLTMQDQLDAMRADFIANASHELRTPLASLRGYIETLQGAAKNDVEAQGRFLSIMLKQAMRMTRLIDDLLSLSRVEMRSHLPPTDTVDLNEVAAHVAQTLEPLIAASNASLNVMELHRPALIRGDRDEIVQAALNLVQNAHKYGGVNVKIEVAVREAPAPNGSPNGLALSVRDDGPGIPAKHIPRLTERFYRVQNTSVDRHRDIEGTGLGLAIVKHVVMRHRAELDVSSAP